MDFNKMKWNEYTSKTWTLGRVALATPHGARSTVLWAESLDFKPMQWSRVFDELNSSVEDSVRVESSGEQ